MKLLAIFILCNIINVIVQTIKSIATVKCGKTSASIINALAYGFYTYIIVLTVCDLPLLTKCIVVGLCNLVGVWLVKFFEEKARKDKLWKVEMTVNKSKTADLTSELLHLGIPHNYIDNIGKYTIFNVYCKSQKESKFVRDLCERYKAKYFVSEAKTL